MRDLTSSVDPGSDVGNAFTHEVAFEVDDRGSVTILSTCGAGQEELFVQLAANHGTDIESILLEMGDPERAKVLVDELGEILTGPPGPADLPWAERANRSMADPDVAPDVVASAIKVKVRVEAADAWQIDGDTLDLVCSRSGGVMGVCTSFDANTTMTAWSVGGAPIEVFLAGGPSGDELARVVDLPGPFTANTELVITIDPERFPTPGLFMTSGTTIDPATVAVAAR